MQTNRLFALVVTASFLTVCRTEAQFTTTNLLINPGAENGLANWIGGGDSNPTFGNSASLNDNISPHSGSLEFVGGHGSAGTLSQTIDLSALSDISLSDIDAGNLSANVSFWEQGYNQGDPSDDASITLTFLDADAGILSSVSTPQVDSHDGTWQNLSQSFAVPENTRSIDYTMTFVNHVGGDLDAFVDDNTLTLTMVPEPSIVSLAAGGALAVGWMRRKYLT